MAIDRGILEQQLQALGEGSRWWDTRELRDLPAVLDPNERILAISRGKIARVRWLRRTWLIVVTERRLLCLRSGTRTSWRQLEVSARHVERVSLRLGLFRARLVVQASDHTYRLLVPKADAYKLEGVLAGLVTSAKVSRPGFAPTRMVGRMIDHVLALPAVAMSPESPKALPSPPRPKEAPPDERIQSMEGELEQLRQQVDFLEDLLRQRQPSPERGARAQAEGAPARRTPAGRTRQPEREERPERTEASARGEQPERAERPEREERGGGARQERGPSRPGTPAVPGDVSADPA